jgi:signal peptidase complex subunit 2
MAKKKEITKQVEAVDVIPVDETEDDGILNDEDTMELLQVDVGDQVKLKQILDETVAATILEMIAEDYRLDNMKLALMTAACAFACVAQFAPVPFPDCRPILGVCCFLYFVLSGILQGITTFIDMDCILLTKSSPTSKNNNLINYGLRVRTNLPRFSEYYTVILEFQNMTDTPYVEQKWSVGQFFDVEGMFDEVGLMEAVREVVHRIEAGKYENGGKPASAAAAAAIKKKQE